MVKSQYDRVLLYSICYRRLARASKLQIFNKKSVVWFFQLLIMRARLLLPWINLRLNLKACIKLHVCKRPTITHPHPSPPPKKTAAAKTDVYIKLAWLFDVADPTSLPYFSTKKYSESLQNNFKRNIRRKCIKFALIYICLSMST